MEIKPDYDSNDGNEKDTFPYVEDIDQIGYFYGVCVIVNNKKATICITESGISVQLMTGHVIHTNIIPGTIFPDCFSLEYWQILHIVKLLESTGMEGKIYTPEEMKAKYRKFDREFGY